MLRRINIVYNGNHKNHKHKKEKLKMKNFIENVKDFCEEYGVYLVTVIACFGAGIGMMFAQAKLIGKEVAKRISK